MHGGNDGNHGKNFLLPVPLNPLTDGFPSPKEIKSWAMKNCSAWTQVVNNREHASEEASAKAVAKNLDAERLLLATYL